ncbi:MAG: glutamyl-tRNA reductase [Acidobacteria bacterium]|nr:glutamyl-tRNA reductase [Acidobacteriota bacterium]
MGIEFLALGLNHRTASVELREKFSMVPDRQKAFLSRLLHEGLFDEAAILSTCNRLEIYGVAQGRNIVSRQIATFLTEWAALGRAEAPFYAHQGGEALRHLFRVASSLDSQIVGETHILGQVKDCYDQARACGSAGRWLNLFFQKSFQVAKRVRTETTITALPVSTGSCAVALVRRIFGDLGGQKVLLIGAGSIGATVARHFSKHHVELWVSNRNREKAEVLAAEVGGKVVAFENWAGMLDSVEIGIFATASEQPLLSLTQAARIMHSRKQRQLLLLDLAIPRNVEANSANLESLFLYDIDRVQSLVDAHYTVRLKEAEKAESIIAGRAASVWSGIGDRQARGMPQESGEMARDFAKPGILVRTT